MPFALMWQGCKSASPKSTSGGDKHAGTFNEDFVRCRKAAGTLISRDRDMTDVLMTSIVLKTDVTLMDIVSTRMLGQFGFLAQVTLLRQWDCYRQFFFPILMNTVLLLWSAWD